MKTIAIRLTDVEAAMLHELQNSNKVYKDLQGMLLQQIRRDFLALHGSKYLKH